MAGSKAIRNATRTAGHTEHRLYVRYVAAIPPTARTTFTTTATAHQRPGHGADVVARPTAAGMNWQAALAWVQASNAAKYLGHSDWRLPNAKELQSIVDYTRAPAVTHSPAIDPVFQTTKLAGGEYPYFWSSTTHLDGPSDRQGTAAVYIALAAPWAGCVSPGVGEYRQLDVHGAGAQRSDPKSGDPADFPHGRGPQGDEIGSTTSSVLCEASTRRSVQLVQP